MKKSCDFYNIHYADENTKSVLFMLSGCASSQSEVGGYYDKIIEKLNKENVTCVTLDVAGNGERYLESVKSFTQDRDDVLKVFDKVSNMEEFKDADFQIMGYSLGALTALQVIDELRENTFSNFIAQGPAWRPNDLQELLDFGGEIPNFNKPINDSEFHMYKMDLDSVKDLQNYLDSNIVVEALNKVKNTTIVFGEEDIEIDKEFLLKLPADITMIYDSDHTMNLFNENKNNSENVMNIFMDVVTESVLGVEKENQNKFDKLDIGDKNSTDEGIDL